MIRFLSTPSARRATVLRGILLRVPLNFYPRPPRGGRPRHRRRSCPTDIFLSTPSARRATLKSDKVTYANTDFYPRPPRGGRRRCTGQLWPGSYFYPRPPRGGRPGSVSVGTGPKNFYPRPPRGGRRGRIARESSSTVFLSTPSARRATKAQGKSGEAYSISIHALREEGDSKNRDKISIFL